MALGRKGETEEEVEMGLKKIRHALISSKN